MSVIQAIVLGIVQGLTEFLPISSSGHLILVPWLFGWESSGLAFDAALHLGTLFAVFAYFRNDILQMIAAIPTALRHPVQTLQFNPAVDSDIDSRHGTWGKLGLLIVIGSVPAGIAGLLAEDAIDQFFHDPDNTDQAVAAVAVLLIAFALLLWLAERTGTRRRSMGDLRVVDSVVVGLAQCLALLPGVSRSGITLTAGLFRGVSRADAARFSFLLGIPLITAAGATSVVDIVRDSPSSSEIVNLIAGMVSAAISGLLAIWGLLRFLQQSSTLVFVVYRIVVGIMVLLVLVSGVR